MRQWDRQRGSAVTDALLIVVGIVVTLVAGQRLLSPSSVGLAPTAILIVLLMGGIALVYLGIGRRRDARRDGRGSGRHSR